MARVLLIYGTTEGQTRTIAGHVAEWLRARGHTVTVEDAVARAAPIAAREADIVILAGSVHGGLYQAALTDLIAASRPALAAVPSAFLSVSLAAADLDPELRRETEHYAERLGRETGWRPDAVAHVAGALRYTRYDFLKRLAMRFISARHGGPVDTGQDHAFTNWQALDEFMAGFIAHAAAAPAPAGRRP